MKPYFCLNSLQINKHKSVFISVIKHNSSDAFTNLFLPEQDTNSLKVGHKPFFLLRTSLYSQGQLKSTFRNGLCSQHWWKSHIGGINWISHFTALRRIRNQFVSLGQILLFWIKNLCLSQWECYVLKPVKFSLVYYLFFSLSSAVLWTLNFLLVVSCWWIASSISNI